MNPEALGLCCPQCRSALDGAWGGDGELACRGCGRRFPVIAGIPDLRIFPDPYISFEDDRAKGRHLAERAADCSFDELVTYYYSITPAVPPPHAAAYARGLQAAEARAEAALAQWAAAGGGAGGDLLDVGCGTGPALAAAARGAYRPVAGVDIAFRWLVVGRKRLAERGLDVPLICACAEALPFRAPLADVVVLDSALELFDDQPRALAECRRVLRAEGRVFVATPNRLSPGPDPHVGLWGGSLLPERWLAAYARRVGAVPPRRQLVHRGSLRRLLRAAGFAGITVFPPRFPDAVVRVLPAARRLVARAYGVVAGIRPAASLLTVIAPILYATARAGRVTDATSG